LLNVLHRLIFALPSGVGKRAMRQRRGVVADAGDEEHVDAAVSQSSPEAVVVPTGADNVTKASGDASDREHVDDAAMVAPAGADKVTKASGDDKAERRSHRGRPSAQVIHLRMEDSLLSPTASPGVDYRGLLNLFMLILIAANLRLVVENIMKYGVLIQPPSSFFDFYRNWPCGLCFLQLIGLVALGWAVERHGAAVLQNDLHTNLLHVAVVFLMFAAPAYAIFLSSSTPSNSVLLLLFSVAWAMKMVSFAHTCFDVRRAIAQGIVHKVCADDEESLRLITEKGFPQCLRLCDMLWFLAYPTLCFQLQYPLLPRVRKRALVRHTVALVFCGALGYVITGQYIQPLLENARKYVQMEPGPQGGQILRVSALGLFERLLKLSLPNLYLWLLIFYALFHCWLNVLGEITRFGDRRFYGDWWNAASFGEYWKKWNLPVHHWCLRHLYFPLLRRGWGKMSAGYVVFFVSGLLHEFVIVVPLRLRKPTVLVTLAFVSQLPLIALTARPLLEVRHRMIGNILFWFAFCFSGQPAAILVYFLLATDPELETVGSLLSLR